MRTIPRYIPKDSTELRHPEGLGVVYLYREGRAAIAYRGKGGRPAWNYSFRDRERAEHYAHEWFASLDGWEQRKAEWRSEANRPHTLKVGNVIYNSWGYDQTNIDFYQVVRTSAHFVWLRRIGANVREVSFMAGPTIPKPNQFISEEVTKHKAHSGQHGNSVTFEHGAGAKWDGQTLYCSWYA